MILIIEVRLVKLSVCSHNIIFCTCTHTEINCKQLKYSQFLRQIFVLKVWNTVTLRMYILTALRVETTNLCETLNIKHFNVPSGRNCIHVYSEFSGNQLYDTMLLFFWPSGISFQKICYLHLIIITGNKSLNIH